MCLSVSTLARSRAFLAVPMNEAGPRWSRKPGQKPPSSLPAPPGGLGEWRDLEDGRDLSMFSHSDYAFDPADNQRYHSRRTIHLARDPAVADFSDAIERAFLDLSRGGGGTLALGAGDFPHSRPVAIPSYCCLRGAGMDRTVLRVADFAAPFAAAGALRARHAERVSVIALTQDGNRARQHARSERERYGRYGVYTHLANFVHLADVRVRGNLRYAFDPHGSNLRWAYFLVIERCVSEGNGLDGFTLDQTLYASVLGCAARGNERHGVNVISGSRFVLVKGCALERNGARSGKGFGLVAQNNATDGKFDTNSVIFAGNTVRDCYRGAVCLRDVWDVRVWRNRFESWSCTAEYVVYEFNETRQVCISENVVVGRPRREIKCINNGTFEAR